MLRFFPLLALALTLSACASTEETLAPADSDPAFSIQKPPSGSLSDSQLAAIAANLRLLEARPLAAGAADGRANLFLWVTGSPDIRVSLNGGVVGPLIQSNSQYKGDLLNQFILSRAAYQIENPGADPTAVNVAGLEGALAAYTVIRSQQGRRARDSFMDSVQERSASGTLVSYVQSGLAGR
jgi:hypothetical protein